MIVIYSFITGSHLPIKYSFCHVMLCISVAHAVMRCLSVHPSVWVSVTFVYFVKTSKYSFIIFSPSDSHNNLVFPYQTMAIFRWEPP